LCGVLVVGLFGRAVSPRPLLFFDLPRTGSLTMREALGLALNSSATPGCRNIPTVPGRHSRFMTVQQARKYYTEDEWDSSYKVSFVRNPWDRIVSLWAFWMEEIHKLELEVSQSTGNPANSSLRTEDDPYLSSRAVKLSLSACGCNRYSEQIVLTASKQRNGIIRGGANILVPPAPALLTNEGDDVSVGNHSYYCSFTRFVAGCADLNEVQHVTDTLNGVKFNTTLFYNVAKLPQLAWITDEFGKFGVDFVGRTENLTNHFYELLVAAGNHPEHAAACANSTQKLMATKNHEAYDAYYGNSMVLEKTNTLFQDDATFFGYNFNKPAPPTPVYKRSLHDILTKAARSFPVSETDVQRHGLPLDPNTVDVKDGLYILVSQY